MQSCYARIAYDDSLCAKEVRGCERGGCYARMMTVCVRSMYCTSPSCTSSRTEKGGGGGMGVDKHADQEGESG